MSKLFLLSVEEARKIPKVILVCGSWYWLRSPGHHSGYAATVSPCGCMNVRGSDVDTDFYSVRPALYLDPADLTSLERTKKGYIKFGTTPNGKPVKWIDISLYMGIPCLLMKKPIEECRFDTESNIYEKSEIYKRLQELDDEIFTNEEKTMIEDFESQERSSEE